MKYTLFDAPLKVYGLPFFEQHHRIERLPAALRQELRLEQIGHRPVGARVAFRTDAPTLTVTLTLFSLGADMGMSLYSCQSIQVWFGHGETRRFAGLVGPKNYRTLQVSATFEKPAVLEDVMLYLPRNEIVVNVEVELPDGAQVLPPTPYRREQPMVFVGSSITEGGHAVSMTATYTNLLSAWLDSDYINLGFSGACRGQLEVADYLCSLNPSVLIWEYDFNAPSADFLQRTHQPFFKRVRSLCPDLPVVMFSAASCDYLKEADLRREIIRKTYTDAVADGDKNVRFVDGRTLFGTEDRHACVSDTIHPNDLGFYRMAKGLLPAVEDVLSK